MTSGPSVVDAILLNAKEHSRLVASLAELEPASTRLKEKSKEIKTVQEALDECEEALKALVNLVRQEQNAEASIGRKLRRLFCKGDVEEETFSQNTRYTNAVQLEKREVDRKNALLERKKNLSDEINSLSSQSEKFDALSAELDLFYDSIFDGPTPGFPGEDQAEQEVKAVQAVQTRVAATLAIEYTVADLLKSAERSITECQKKIKDALYWSSAAMLAGGSNAGRNQAAALKAAHNFASDFQTQLAEARQLSPSISPIGPLTLAEKEMMRNGGDPSFHETLAAAATELDSAHLKIGAAHASASSRVKAAKAVVEETARTANDCKKELVKIRRKVFEQTLVDHRTAQPRRKVKKKTSSPTSPSPSDSVEHETPPPNYVESPNVTSPPMLPSPPETPDRNEAPPLGGKEAAVAAAQRMVSLNRHSLISTGAGGADLPSRSSTMGPRRPLPSTPMARPTPS